MSNTRCPNALKQLPSSPPFFHSAASWLLGGHETLKTWQEFKRLASIVCVVSKAAQYRVSE